MDMIPISHIQQVPSLEFCWMCINYNQDLIDTVRASQLPAYTVKRPIQNILFNIRS
jgi:hypothetical protein